MFAQGACSFGLLLSAAYYYYDIPSKQLLSKDNLHL
jgi:hypothetical protein